MRAGFPIGTLGPTTVASAGLQQLLRTGYLRSGGLWKVLPIDGTAERISRLAQEVARLERLEGQGIAVTPDEFSDRVASLVAEPPAEHAKFETRTEGLPPAQSQSRGSDYRSLELYFLPSVELVRCIGDTVELGDKTMRAQMADALVALVTERCEEQSFHTSGGTFELGMDIDKLHEQLQAVGSKRPSEEELNSIHVRKGALQLLLALLHARDQGDRVKPEQDDALTDLWSSLFKTLDRLYGEDLPPELVSRSGRLGELYRRFYLED